MEPWVTLVIAGAAIAGYGWLKREPQKAVTVNEEAYDKLLEDLETENRELVDAVAAFKREQDDTVGRLGRRIRELELQMEERANRAGEPPVRAASAPTAESFRLAVEPQDRKSPARAAAESGGASRLAAPAAPEPATVMAAGPQQTAVDAPQTRAASTVVQPADEEGSAIDQPASIRERYGELVALYERGRSVEQVARAMNMNKGEVQLILQLAKREVSPHD